MIFVMLFVAFSLIDTTFMYAQEYACGYSSVLNRLPSEQKNQFSSHSFITERRNDNHNYIPDTIPIVFHIILNEDQINELGGRNNIESLIEKQLTGINNDFCAQNGDSILIPKAFKHLYGNPRIVFQLAKTAPDGRITDGYEILTRAVKGFYFETSTSIAFKDAKYSENLGANAWDPSTYVNIWVINPLQGGVSSNLTGVTIPPYLTQSLGLNYEEAGIVLHYKQWVGNLKGRTLTHELGHYFGLHHVWGDDNGLCPDNGGKDDGISDTPPQSKETKGCPNFPLFDSCSYSENGIMFMNYMDYTTDDCRVMFTAEQAAKMKSMLLPFGDLYSLTQHPDVLHEPTDNAIAIDIYPNPASEKINVRFSLPAKNLMNIRILDLQGRIIAMENTDSYQRAFYAFDVRNYARGIYLMQLNFPDEAVITKFLVQ